MSSARPGAPHPGKKDAPVPKIRLGKKSVNLPENRQVRIAVGVLLVIGGVFGFLPILGFWMIPLGFVVLAQDLPVVRRVNRRVGVAIKRRWTGIRPARERQSTTP